MDNASRAKEILENTWDQVKKPGISYTRWRYKIRLFIALAQVYAEAGDRERGLAFAGRALRLARNTGARKHEARALCMKARILMKSRPGLALKSLKQALAMSLAMGTRLLTERIERVLKGAARE
jgi:tetratricopeptide (TPR) repeat protein